MKTCAGCKYGEWHRTESGRLHPSGDGRCRYPYKVKPLPASMYWIAIPTPTGGHINRREPLKDDCPYYTRDKS